jgi:hypothetical protein
MNLMRLGVVLDCALMVAKPAIFASATGHFADPPTAMLDCGLGVGPVRGGLAIVLLEVPPDRRLPGPTGAIT